MVLVVVAVVAAVVVVVVMVVVLAAVLVTGKKQGAATAKIPGAKAQVSRLGLRRSQVWSLGSRFIELRGVAQGWGLGLGGAGFKVRTDGSRKNGEL